MNMNMKISKTTPLFKKQKKTSIEQSKPNSCEFFKPHWLCWKILGIKPNTANGQEFTTKYAYILYSIVLNLLVTVFYPLHLCLHLFHSDSMADNIKNFAVSVTCVACTLKFIIYSTKLTTIQHYEKILQRLDARITAEIEINYFKQLKHSLRNIGLLFVTVYLSVGITAELSFIFREQRDLLYPAWFPFNWMESTAWFYVANLYQIVGIFFLLLENFVDDCFPPMALCMLSGHIKILSIRVSNIGYDDKTLEENERQMDNCVKDQMALYE